MGLGIAANVDGGQTLVDGTGRGYRVLRTLGEGGFGTVYLAEVLSAGGLEQLVALKVLHPGADARTQAAERLADEARLLAKLRHPVIVGAHDLVTIDDRLALVTTYVEGWDLADALADKVLPLPLPALFEALGQVARALHTAWTELGVVHRDVKPANIRIGRHGNPMLLDFGIARSDGFERAAETASHVVIGSFATLSPERILSGPLHPGSDVFSLGCMLLESASGTALYGGLDAAAVFGLVLRDKVFDEHVARRCSALHGPLGGLVAQCLAYEPDDRPAAGVLADALEGLAFAEGGPPLRAWCVARAEADASGAVMASRADGSVTDFGSGPVIASGAAVLASGAAVLASGAAHVRLAPCTRTLATPTSQAAPTRSALLGPRDRTGVRPPVGLALAGGTVAAAVLVSFLALVLALALLVWVLAGPDPAVGPQPVIVLPGAAAKPRPAEDPVEMPAVPVEAPAQPADPVPRTPSAGPRRAPTPTAPVAIEAAYPASIDGPDQVACSGTVEVDAEGWPSAMDLGCSDPFLSPARQAVSRWRFDAGHARTVPVAVSLVRASEPSRPAAPPERVAGPVTVRVRDSIYTGIQVNCRSGFMRRVPLVAGTAVVSDVPIGESCLAYFIGDGTPAPSRPVEAGGELACWMAPRLTCR